MVQPQVLPNDWCALGLASILAFCVDQVHRALHAGLPAQREAFGQVVEDVDDAHGSRQALLVGQVELVRDALAHGQGRAFGVAIAAALEAHFIQAQAAGNLATAAVAVGGLSGCSLRNGTGNYVGVVSRIQTDGILDSCKTWEGEIGAISMRRAGSGSTMEV